MEKLRGIRTPAWLTALMRSVVEAALFASTAVLIDWLQQGGLPDHLTIYGTVAILLLRNVEGILDEIDPVKKRRRKAADKVS